LDCGDFTPLLFFRFSSVAAKKKTKAASKRRSPNGAARLGAFQWCD
jgi:hypothetical protein